MDITITISTNNTAFEDSEKAEVARILADIAASMERFGIASGKVRDINGNTCGKVEVE